MTRTKWLLLTVPLPALYLLLGALTITRQVVWMEPDRAAQLYLEAFQARDTAKIYAWSQVLGPHLDQMLAQDNLSEEKRAELKAGDFARWQAEFEKQSPAQDSLAREKALLGPGTIFAHAQPASYKAETLADGDLYLVSFSDIDGLTYHCYFEFKYGQRHTAPAVHLFQNMKKDDARKVRSVVIRVQVSRRLDQGWGKSLLMEWNWLESVAFLYPTGWFHAEEDPGRIWTVALSLDIDLLALKTYAG